MTSFAYRTQCTLVLQPGDSVLSLTAESGSPKPLLQPRPVLAGRLPPGEHYDRLPEKPRKPFLVAGVRNVLANLRCIAYSRATSPAGRLVRLDEEYDLPGRPFHAICCRRGAVTIEEFFPGRMLSAPQPNVEEFDWLVTGTPVCWDCDDDDLFDRMVSDAADHSHVWRIPRGAHPAANSETQRHWSLLHDLFIETLGADRITAAAELRTLAETLKLERERDYLHCVWGIRDDGSLVIHVAHGSLDDLGRRVRELGCRRAVCVENSGSVALYVVRDPDDRPWQPLISAPNFRPAGSAFVFFALPDDRYDVLGENGDRHSTMSSQ